MDDHNNCPICEVFYPNGKHTKKKCKEMAKGKEMRREAKDKALGALNKMYKEVVSGK